MWDVALSTMWGIGRFEDLGDFFACAQQIGFRRFELNHQVNSHMLDGINLDRYCISAVHEPCPADVSTAALRERDWLVSSTDEACRRQGVRAVRRSIDIAQQLGAEAIVVHAGRVGVDEEVEQELWTLHKAGGVHSAEYREKQELLVAARAAKAEAHLEATRRSIQELLAYAGRAGIRLGLENRYHYLDIPLLGEMGSLLALADDGQLGFWYDVGHAQTLENLGFDAHEEWLRRYAARMIGVHLHDIKGLTDHYAAGLGDVDWDMIAGYLPREAIRTFEFRSQTSPEQLGVALQFLADRGCLPNARARS